MELIDTLVKFWHRLNPDMPGVVKADATTCALLVIEVALAILSAYLAGRLAKKNQLGRDDKPTSLSERGAFTNWFLGLRRIGIVFGWAGNRFIKKESAPGGKGFLFGGGAKVPIYYENGLHILCSPMFDELRKIQQNGKILFKGPITRDGNPTGTVINLGREGAFEIRWGEGDYIVPITVTPTDSYIDSFFGIESRWPLFGSVVWLPKRLGTGPGWPMMDYTCFRYCRYSDAILPSVASYIPPTFTLDGQMLGITGHVNGSEGVGYFITPGGIGTVTVEEGIHYRASAVKDNDQVELTGNTMTSGTLTVLKVVISSAIDPITFLTIPVLHVYPKGGVSGADDNGTLQLYTRADDDGINPAHAIAELLFAPWPWGLGLDPAPFNVNSGGDSLDSLAVLMQTEGMKASLLSKDGNTAEEVVAAMLQDIGVIMPLNTATGLYDFKPIRQTVSSSWPAISNDMLAGSFPEIETPQGELPRSEVIFSFADRANYFRDMTIQVAGDGQASYGARQGAETVQMPSVIDFDVAAKISERRSQELLAGGAVFRFTANRGVRELLPGAVVTLEGIDEPVRIISIEIQGNSAEVKIEAISDFMGVKTNENDPVSSGDPAGGNNESDIAPPIQFDLFQVPSSVIATTTVIVPQIRASSSVLDTTANISADDTTYYEKETTGGGQAGGLTTTGMLVGDTTGPTFDLAGPDASTMQDLTTDSGSYMAGRQILMIVSTLGTEICFLESVTALGGASYQANNIIRAQYGTTAKAHPSGARVYIFDPDQVLGLQDVLLTTGTTIFVKMIPGGLTTAEVGSKSITIA